MKKKKSRNMLGLYDKGSLYGTVSPINLYKSGGHYGVISIKNF